MEPGLVAVAAPSTILNIRPTFDRLTEPEVASPISGTSRLELVVGEVVLAELESVGPVFGTGNLRFAKGYGRGCSPTRRQVAGRRRPAAAALMMSPKTKGITPATIASVTVMSKMITSPITPNR